MCLPAFLLLLPLDLVGWAIVGSLLALGFYIIIKAMEYETANPDQDAMGDKGAHFDPETGDEKPARPMDPLGERLVGEGQAQRSETLQANPRGQASVANVGPLLGHFGTTNGESVSGRTPVDRYGRGPNLEDGRAAGA